jgi:hypothetical protein
MKPDSIYGLDFDIRFQNGSVRYNVLGVTWKTALRLQILSVDNRSGGEFRRFRVIGDSLTVSFSEPIDTSSEAVAPFRVNMTDINNRFIKTIVRWSPSLMSATIFNLDTLPTADCDASPAYTSEALGTRAVRSITFDLVTATGEQALAFKPRNENIEIHTEKGLCVMNSNILANHSDRIPVYRSESAISEFPLDGEVTVTFNKEIDTALMLLDTAGLTEYAGIREGTMPVDVEVSFSPDAKTIRLRPVESLESATNYYVWLKKVPGKGIAYAYSINKNAGSFSGKAINSNLLDRPFQAK